MSLFLSKFWCRIPRKNRLSKTVLFEAGAVFLLVLVAILVNWKIIFQGIIFESHDLHYHLTWLQHFSKQLSEGIWYPRWLAGTNYGYGSPTFVFYPPLVYYFGSLLKMGSLDAERAIAGLFFLAVFLSGLNFYIYGRTKWHKSSALLGALAYMLAPYMSYNIYNRGALAETFALVFIPLGLLITDQAIAEPKWRLGLALYFSLLTLTHVPSLLLYAIFWFLYVLCLSFKYAWKDILLTMVSAAIGFGLVAFYLLPAIFEQSFVNVASLRGVTGGFREHLITLTKPGHRQSFFIYGLSSVIILSGINLSLHHKTSARFRETVYWLSLAIAILFLMSYPSIPIWQASPTLQMVQFPWRLLGLLCVSIAALFGLATSGILSNDSPKKWLPLLLVLVVGVFAWNARYSYVLSLRYPGFYHPGDLTSAQVQGRWKVRVFKKIETAIRDPYTDRLKDAPEYRPWILKTGLPAKDPTIGQPAVSVRNGNASIQIDRWDSYQRAFHVTATESSTIRVRIYSYPAWHLYVDGKPHSINTADDGTMVFDLDAGTYSVTLIYQWTRAFTIGVVLSVLSLLLLTVWGVSVFRWA